MNLLYEKYENINIDALETHELIDDKYINLLIDLEDLEKKSEISTDLEKKYNREDILADLLRFTELYPNIEIKNTTMRINIIKEPSEDKEGYYLLFEDPVYPIKEIKEINGSDDLITVQNTEHSNKQYCNYTTGTKSYYIEKKDDLEILEKTGVYFIYMVSMFTITIIFFIIFIIYILYAGLNNIISLLMLLFIIVFLGLALWMTFLYLDNKQKEVDIISFNSINCIDVDKTAV